MGKIRRGGFVFITWKGDHEPEHVHVYRDGRPIVKWDLEKDRAMRGRADRRLRRLIRELRAEGKL
jgi:hypothetical protein